MRIPDLNFMITMKRYRWYDVEEKYAKRILQNNYFMSEEDFKNIRTTFEKGKQRVAIDRYGALGDIIQLLPIARHLKAHYDVHLTLVCQLSYGNILKREKDAFDEVISKAHFNKFQFDRVFYLDGVLECDHSTQNIERNHHRVKLYEQFFGITLQKYDFHLTLLPQEINKMERLLNDNK